MARARGTLNSVRVEGNVAYIDLDRGHQAIIDADDLDRVMAVGPWYADPSPQGTLYARRNRKRAKGVCDTVPNRLHRLIMNPEPGMEVDHKNHQTLDCRKANLRVCTKAENQWNRLSANRTSASGVRGVIWDKKAEKWRATVHRNKERFTLGWFTSIRDAERAVIEARKRLHGEFSAP